MYMWPQTLLLSLRRIERRGKQTLIAGNIKKKAPSFINQSINQSQYRPVAGRALSRGRGELAGALILVGHQRRFGSDGTAAEVAPIRTCAIAFDFATNTATATPTYYPSWLLGCWRTPFCRPPPFLFLTTNHPLVR